MAMAKPHLEHMDAWIQWKQMQSNEAKQELIKAYLPLVQHVSSKMAGNLPPNISQEDLSSFGIMGLIDAIGKFDIERGLQFETYALWRIKGAIIDHLRQGDWVPRSVRDKSKKIEEAYQRLEQQHLRSVTDKEVCAYLDIDQEQLHKIIQEASMSAFSSLEEPVQDEDSDNLMARISDDKMKRPEDIVNETYLKESLAAAIEHLTERERTVVSLYYYEELSLSEIAEVMSLTPSRISQLHSKAIWRLRGCLERDKQLLREN